VPLYTNIWQHIKPLAGTLKTPQNPLHYRLEGKIKTGWLFGTNLRFNNQGEMTPADYFPPFQSLRYGSCFLLLAITEGAKPEAAARDWVQNNAEKVTAWLQ